MIRSLLHALRVGASVSNPTPLKWAGVAVAVAIIALEVAKSYGVLADVQESALIELVMAALVLYSQIASTEKIGILPPDRRIHDTVHERMQPESNPKIIARLSDAELERIADLLHGVDDMSERVRTERMRPNTDAPESRNSAGFPDGPFFGDS